MVSGTSSCSLSSTAVAPIRKRSVYSSPISPYISFSRLDCGIFSTELMKLAYSRSEMMRMATRSVLKPMVENWLSSLSRLSFWLGLSLALMIESACVRRGLRLW